MRRSLLLLGGLMAIASASATSYSIGGDIKAGDNWWGSNTFYVFNQNGHSFDWEINQAVPFRANCYYALYADNTQMGNGNGAFTIPDEGDVKIDISHSGNNDSWKSSITGDVYLYYNPDTKQLTFSRSRLNYKTYTYAMAIPDNWDASNIKVHIWSTSGRNATDWSNRPNATVTSRRVEINGKRYRVAEYTFDSFWEPDCFIFESNGTQIEHSGVRPFAHQIYSVTSNDNTVYHEFDLSQLPTVYLNTGGWTVGNVRVVMMKGGKAVETGTMTQVNADEPNIWSYTTDKAESDVDYFHFVLDRKKTDGSNNWDKDVTLASENAGEGVWDHPNRFKYIYGTGVNVANQSYLTYQQYRQLKDNTKNAVYIVGDDNIGQNWDPYLANECAADDGVIYFDFVAGALGNATARKFKVSWVNVNKVMTDLGVADSETVGPRKWATFNLGIIGSNEEYFDGVNNATTTFDYNKTLPYNNYSEADWNVNVRNNPLTVGNTYYIVIDSHKECRSITLLSFNPNPALEFSGKITPMTLGYENALQLHRQGRHGYASANTDHHGLMLFDEVNKVEADLSIAAANASDVRNAGFSVVYDFFDSNDTKMFDYKGIPTNVHVEYLPLAGNLTMRTRALYTDTKTGMHFHSKRPEATLGELAAKFEAPQISIDRSKLSADYKYDEATKMYTFGTELDVVYSHGSTDQLVRTMDFEAIYPVEGAKRTLSIGGQEWNNSYSEGDAYNESHAWNKAILNNRGEFSLKAPESIVAKGLSTIEPEMTTVTVIGKAVYPFIVRTAGPVITANGSQQNAPARRAAEQINDIDNYSITAGVRTATDSADFSKAVGEIAAIETISVDNDTDAPARYYNLQGVEVMNPEAGQIYIVRRGQKATKQIWK